MAYAGEGDVASVSNQIASSGVSRERRSTEGCSDKLRESSISPSSSGTSGRQAAAVSSRNARSSKINSGTLSSQATPAESKTSQRNTPKRQGDIVLPRKIDQLDTETSSRLSMRLEDLLSGSTRGGSSSSSALLQTSLGQTSYSSVNDATEEASDYHAEPRETAGSGWLLSCCSRTSATESGEAAEVPCIKGEEEELVL
mmetsp:Transcript_39426/g.99211  ORF Transcript_39426/g.99211 Transcript_39426/m.99211 type:complete len:199 (+) Transcript_39426:96-692(+)|eukprot:CAMPEP_0115702270 /NCGR_PEP_ID=MMETSP0272-20121206/68448_1 /TAXON_ID=71861 /ORGANISM="Scrippsiella trochoidea, Strain CCMP3099" /LENGTH=198 /DNA_ID=CAMNT_0003143001 /DNA_START=22 /DNA_END=618 /DNA_ORIENTATION=-